MSTVHILKENYFQLQMAFMIPKHVSWKEDFDRNLLWMVDAGIPWKLVLRNIPIPAMQKNSQGMQRNALEPLLLEHFFMPLTLWLLILVCSVGFFCCEMWKGYVKVKEVQWPVPAF